MTLFKKSLFLASILVFLPMLNGYAQDVQKILDEVSQKIEYAQYEDADTLLCSIDDTQITTPSDSAMYYIYKGICLNQLFRYKEAIPFLEKAIHRMETRPEFFGYYIESLYWQGNCYINQEQYDKAERSLRKVMIKDYKGLCKFTTAALYDLTIIYNKQKYTKLANECIDRIRWEIITDSLETWGAKVLKLYDLARWLYSNDLNEKADSILEKRIKEGITNNVWICCAYVEYIILMARNNEVNKVRDLLRNAKEYFRKTRDFEFNNEVLCILYDRIAYAFYEAGNLDEGERYLDEGERYLDESERYLDESERY